MEILIVDKKVHITMKSYLLESIAAYGEPINSLAISPSRRNLMVVDEEAEMLDDNKKAIFRWLSYCMSLNKLVWTYIQQYFFCARVKNPTTEDWIKLHRLLQYIHGTIDKPRFLSIRNFSEMSIYVDASHASHMNAREHKGGCVVMGDGVLRKGTLIVINST